MCGIIGYLGKRSPKDILIDGLKKLEYRGYDSAGIALKNGEEIQIIKSVGKIKYLEEKIEKEKLIDSHIGIAHTRWATHGEPNLENAHPHKVGKITLVHNGIIENASILKEKLRDNNVSIFSFFGLDLIFIYVNVPITEEQPQTIDKFTEVKELLNNNGISFKAYSNETNHGIIIEL